VRQAKKKRILLSGVFGPYGVDDVYGRKENVMELCHNQVTRMQGIASIRHFLQTFGLYFLAENVESPVTVLDFPTEKRFVEELKKYNYDLVGISFIVPNVAKARRMAELTRRYAPKAEIVIGNHGTVIKGIENIIACDYVVRGEGIRWLREYLGEDTSRPIFHPSLISAMEWRLYGIPVPMTQGALVPGLGCPYGCCFCATSHFFGKKYLPLVENGDELFSICCRQAAKLNTNEFTVLDENILIHETLALELLAAMKRENRFFTFSIFASADAIKSFGIDNMLRMGVDLVWIGVESKKPVFHKTRSIDMGRLIADLRKAGIVVVGSAIVGLDHHDKQGIEEDIDYIVSMKCDMTQFMLFFAIPATRLYEDCEKRGLIDFDLPYEEWNGQKYINWRHPHLTRDELKWWLDEAFRREYDRLGASIVRMAQTTLNGYKYLEGSESDPLLTQRREKMYKKCLTFRQLFPTMKRFAHNESERDQIREIEEAYYEAFGSPVWRTRIVSRIAESRAFLYSLRLKLGPDIRQPRTRCVRYRWQLK